MILEEAIKVGIDSDLKICVSLSSHPGRLGSFIHNTGYKILGLPFRYIACEENDIEEGLQLIREAKGIVQGISLARPFKIKALSLVDHIEERAKSVGAVNTIFYNKSGYLSGYNTDVFGFHELAVEAGIKIEDSIAVIGTGGAARAVIEYLHRGQADLIVYGRNEKELDKLYKTFNVKIRYLEEPICPGSTVINCTPIGGLFIPEFLDETRMIKYIHLQVLHNEELKSLRNNYGFPCYDGRTMALQQALIQFKVYTRHDPPELEIKDALNKFNF